MRSAVEAWTEADWAQVARLCRFFVEQAMFLDLVCSYSIHF